MTPAAFTEVFVTSHNYVYGWMLKHTGEPEAAEDLAAETFTRAWQAWHRLPDTADVTAWLFTIARHLLTDRRRRQKANPPPVPLLDFGWVEAGGWRTDWSDRVDAQLDAHDETYRLLARLTDNQQRIIHLICGEGLTYDAAADRLGIPRGTARRRMHLARTALRRARRRMA